MSYLFDPSTPVKAMFSGAAFGIGLFIVIILLVPVLDWAQSKIASLLKK